MYHFLQECAAKLLLQLRAAKMIFTIWRDWRDSPSVAVDVWRWTGAHGCTKGRNVVFPVRIRVQFMGVLASKPISILFSSLFTVPFCAHFHMTSSVFDFCLLEIGHGVNIESFDQSCQELDLFILFIWWWPLYRGAHIWQGHALMWALIAAGHREKRGPGLCNGRRWMKDDCRCGSRASEPCLSQLLASKTYLTPYRWSLIIIKRHSYATFSLLFST